MGLKIRLQPLMQMCEESWAVVHEHVPQIDRAGGQRPYQNITDVSDAPGKTSDRARGT